MASRSDENSQATDGVPIEWPISVRPFYNINAIPFAGASFANSAFATPYGHSAVSFAAPSITNAGISFNAPLFTRTDIHFGATLFGNRDAPFSGSMFSHSGAQLGPPLGTSYANGNESPVLMQCNSRRILAPPSDWVGPPPSSECELYVRRIPRTMELEKFMVPFFRFGRVYEIRLPMQNYKSNRGFAYVKYTNEEDAARALLVLSHLYVKPSRKFMIARSYEKSRLYMNNIPRHLTESEIERKLREIFPTLQRIYIPGGNFFEGQLEVSTNALQVDFAPGERRPLEHNRGHLFVQFESHAVALEAKKSVSTGLIYLWGREVKVAWANNIRYPKPLYDRNMVKMKNCNLRPSPYRYNCLMSWQPTNRSRQLKYEPLDPNGNIDFDAVLRLKCIANYWQIPVIIFSTYIPMDAVQYCAVMLRNACGTFRGIFCVIDTDELVDLHSRLCEVVCTLIDTIGTFPDYNYVFFVTKDTAHLIGMIVYGITSMKFVASCGVPAEFRIDLNELMDMGWATVMLSTITETTLLNFYKRSFNVSTACTYLQNWAFLGRRIVGTIMPKYRNKPALAYNLNDTQIVLVLCSTFTGTNGVLPSHPYFPFSVAALDVGYDIFHYVKMTLLPLAQVQRHQPDGYVLNCVKFGNMQFYHPAQRINVPPLWVSGHSYSQSIKQQQRTTETN